MIERILRLPAVLERTGLSRSTIYLLLSRRAFPAPVRLTQRAVGWWDRDVVDWLKSKEQPDSASEHEPS